MEDMKLIDDMTTCDDDSCEDVSHGHFILTPCEDCPAFLSSDETCCPNCGLHGKNCPDNK